MDEDKGLSLGTIVVMVVIGVIALWLVFGVLHAVFSVVKGIVTLAVVGLALYGGYRLLGGSKS